MDTLEAFARLQQDLRAPRYKAEAGRWKYYGDDPPAPPRWLIKHILPETGTGLLAGQWGTYKTTTTLDIAFCAMTGSAFANKYIVKRHGAPSAAMNRTARLKTCVNCADPSTAARSCSE
jgi:hypothetical protein